METSITLTPKDFIQRDEGYWMTQEALANWLGFAMGSAGVRNIYSKHKDELEPFTALINPKDPKTCLDSRQLLTSCDTQSREYRIFSELGCYIVAMLAKTEKAKAFRKALALLLRELQRNSFKFETINESYRNLLSKVVSQELVIYCSAKFNRPVHKTSRMIALRNTLQENELAILYGLRTDVVRQIFSLYDRLMAGEDFKILEDAIWPTIRSNSISITKFERNERIIELYLMKHSVRDIHRLTGISRRTIAAIIDESGVVREEEVQDAKQ